MVAVINIDAYLFFGFLSPDLSPWVVLCHLIVSKPNLEVATERLLDQLLKIPK